MKSSAKKVELASVDDLFSTEESRLEERLEKIQEIPLSELHPFKNHPFKVKDDEAMLETADSIKQYGTPGRYSSFICGNYSRSGKGACTIHTIYENVLTQLVLEDIREKARFAEYDPEQLVRQIIRLKDKEAKSRLSSCEQELKTYTARLSELERLMQNLYEDKCAGTIPQTVFQTLMHKYEAERAEKSEAIPELERKVKSYLENRTDANHWLTIIRQYTEITELDESILFELVDRIEVGETQKVGGQRICDLRVYYRYVGNVDAALTQEERRQPLEEAI